MYETIKGIVLKKNRFADNSAYLTVLTETGQVKFSAKGILSPKSKNAPAAALWCYSEFVISRRGDSATLSSASLIKPLIRQGVDFEGLACANYISSLAHDVVFTEEDAPFIFSLLGNALGAINSKAPADIVKAVFEIKLMAALGFYPDIEHCPHCSKPFREGFFLPEDGTCLCRECEAFSEKKKIPLSYTLLKGIEALLTLDNKAAFGIRFSDDTTRESFVRLCEEFSLNHLDCALGALNYYKTNVNMDLK